MKIYTRTGDRGETGLFGGGRVPKDHLRVEAYGAVDELNATLGVAISRLETEEGDAVSRLREVQADLFTVGANLATPEAVRGGKAAAQLPRLSEGRVAELEAWIDEVEGSLEPLRSFVLPGGTPAGAALHLARTVCRRAERRVVSLAREEEVAEGIVVYLNRLSDLLFSLARSANHGQGVADVAWNPNRRGDAG